MVNVKKLKGILAEREISQAQMAKILGITPKTFYNKMNKKVFDSDEIEIMISKLTIPPEHCMDIFFAKGVTQ